MGTLLLFGEVVLGVVVLILLGLLVRAILLEEFMWGSEPSDDRKDDAPPRPPAERTE